MRSLRGKPISFLQMDARQHFLTAILCKVPHALSEELLEEVVPEIAEATRLTCWSAQMQDVVPTMSVKILWRGDHIPYKVKVGFLGRFDTKSFTPEPNQCYKCLRVWTHRSSVYSKSCEVSALWGESPVQTMPGSERQARGSKGQMGKLPGGASSLQPVLPKKKRDSTSSYQTNPCPAPTRTSQTKNPCQKRLSTRAQNQANSSSSSNNPQTRLYDSGKMAE